VGLALALDLSCRGIECTLIDKADGSVTHSKMGIVSVRSMELCRRWGVAEQVRHCGFPQDYPLDIVFCTSLRGWTLGRRAYPSMGEEPLPAESPEKKQRCPQLWFDPIMAAAVRARPLARLRYRAELTGFRDHGDHVEVQALDRQTGQPLHWSAGYLVGCDGAGSFVRQNLGIEMEGDPALSYSVGIYFRAPGLVRQHDKGPAERYMFTGPDGLWGNLTVVDGDALWRLTVIGSRERLEAATFDANAWVERALGATDIAYTIDSVLPWRRSRLVASRYAAGRVMIAGDAAHVMPPNGGYGMNTGLADAADLGWKLEAALQGWAGPGLLQSYDAERRPVGAHVVEIAAENFSRYRPQVDYSRILEDSPAGERTRRMVAAQVDESTVRQWETLGITLGTRYEDSPICVPDGTPAPPDDPSDYLPTARPGHRAPHAWLSPDRSTLDLFGSGFVLLKLNDAATSAEPLLAAARQRGVPLRCIGIAAPAARTLYGQPWVLVRPDGYVAWRGAQLPDPPGPLLDRIRGAA
jgi:2-polyprenyl-6-methoxyphenol hydroxylase-like FAD-dependent oxidoreductase